MSLIVVATSHRVAPGMLTWRAWDVLRSSRVYAGSAQHPQLPYLREAGINPQILDEPVTAIARRLVTESTAGESTAADGTVAWLAAADGDEDLLHAVSELLVGHGGRESAPEAEVVHGSYDLPGARLLDVVTTMDVLRAECPWDAKQTHESLAPHLLEESYEALEAIELGDARELCEELGDVLLQVAFHARIAEERTGETRFTIDDVAAGIVDKLTRRHPHVFGSVTVTDTEEVRDNWAAIKAAERAAKNEGDAGSVLDGVPFGQPALLLAHALQRRAVRSGIPAELMDAPAGAGDAAGLGWELFSVVSRARELGTDPEVALRAACRDFRERVQAWELKGKP